MGGNNLHNRNKLRHMTPLTNNQAQLNSKLNWIARKPRGWVFIGNRAYIFSTVIGNSTYLDMGADY